MYIIKQYHNEARREALNDLTKPYADALYDKYFEMAPRQIKIRVFIRYIARMRVFGK